MLNIFISLCFLFLYSSINGQTPCDRNGSPYSGIPGDTTIVLPGGTSITMNRCEFFDKRDCLEIIEITEPSQLQTAGINMYDERGNILITCGMIKIGLKDCGSPCFEVPIKVKLNIRFMDCSQMKSTIPNLYFNNGAGWVLQKDSKPEIQRENGNNFMYFETKCPIFINCDVPKKGRKTKFIAPKGSKIARIRLGISCPLFYTDEKISGPRRRAKLRLLCVNPSAAIIQGLMIDEKGDTVQTDQRKLSELKHGKGRMNCNKVGRGFFDFLFGWMSPGKGEFRKKYYL